MALEGMRIHTGIVRQGWPSWRSWDGLGHVRRGIISLPIHALLHFLTVSIVLVSMRSASHCHSKRKNTVDSWRALGDMYESWRAWDTTKRLLRRSIRLISQYVMSIICLPATDRSVPRRSPLVRIQVMILTGPMPQEDMDSSRRPGSFMHKKWNAFLQDSAPTDSSTDLPESSSIHPLLIQNSYHVIGPFIRPCVYHCFTAPGAILHLSISYTPVFS
jgi:hypothetical protein